METPPARQRRDSNASQFSLSSMGSLDSEEVNRSRMPKELREFALQAKSKQTQIQDHSEVFSVTIILSACLVAACCGVAAFSLHLAVQLAGCLGGVNGCNSSLLFDMVEPLGITKSVYFIISSSLSGFLCSLIIHSSFAGGVAGQCKGGGTAGTKIAISSGKNPSSWIAFFRIILAALYMGGGNTLGTEGPIIHLSTALSTSLAGIGGARRRKVLSMFGVIGAAAGISAGFNVLITGFIYTIEELTRTLSRKIALIITLAAAVAMVVKDYLEELLHHFFHNEHASLVPDRKVWTELTTDEIRICLFLTIPIGVLNGIAGWVFCRCAWAVQNMLENSANGKSKIHLPARFHLAVIGFITGCLGAVAYEITGVNGVWGTTIGAIPEAINNKSITWSKALLLFCMKFFSFILATAAGGPGGLLVPSLASGGLIGIFVGLASGGSVALTSACAVVGMGSLFSSVLHLPVSGVIIVFELTRADILVLHVVVANFIALNVAARLPHGEHSFVHLNLEKSKIWQKLGGQDFIETDDHENAADTTVGVQRLHSMKSSALKDFFMTDAQRMRGAFESWRSMVRSIDLGDVVDIVVESWDGPIFRTLYLHKVWGAWRNELIRDLRRAKAKAEATVAVCLDHAPQRRTSKAPLMHSAEGDLGLRPSFCEDVYQDGSTISQSQTRRAKMTQGDQGLRPSFGEDVFDEYLTPSTSTSSKRMPNGQSALVLPSLREDFPKSELTGVALEIHLQQSERERPSIPSIAEVGRTFGRP